MVSAAKNRMIEEVKRDLFSGNDVLVMKALNKSREKGTPEFVEPLIALYAGTTNDTFKAEISDMLSTLKVTKIEQVFTQALVNQSYKHIRKDLLAFMWSSGLQPVKSVSVITDMALEGPFEVTLEALTLLESIEDPIEEDQILDGVTRVKQAIGSTKDEGLKTLLSEYLQVLESRSESDDFDA